MYFYFRAYRTDNGGQIVKEFLINNGIDLSCFNYKSKDISGDYTRRCKRKTKGTSIPLPCDPTKVKEELGDLGELIVC